MTIIPNARSFWLNLSKSGIGMRAEEVPEANAIMSGTMVLVARHERKPISKRTKAALTATKHGR